MTNLVPRRPARARALEERIAARCPRSRLETILRLFVGQYPQHTTGDVDIYVRQLLALIARYPAEIIGLLAEGATNPMPASAFLPSVPQVREVLDRRLNRLLEARDWERDIERQRGVPAARVEEETADQKAKAVANWEPVRAEIGVGALERRRPKR